MRCARWMPTCRRTRRAGPASSSPRRSRGKPWPTIYRDMTEAAHPQRRRAAADRGSQERRARHSRERTREYIAQVVERLHREVRYTGVEFGDARLIPEYPVRDAAPPVRRLQGQVHAAGRGAARLGHRGLSGAALRGRRPGRVARTARPRHVRSRHRVRAGRDAGKDLWIDATAEYARVGTLPAQDTRPPRARHPRGHEGADAHARRCTSADNRQVETREFIPRRIRPGARGRDHRDPRHRRRRIPQLVRRRRHQGAARSTQDLHARRLPRQGADELRAHGQRRTSRSPTP